MEKFRESLDFYRTWHYNGVKVRKNGENPWKEVNYEKFWTSDLHGS